MGAFMAIYYWNTAGGGLPHHSVGNSVQLEVPSQIPCQELNELVICDLIEEEEVQPSSDILYDGWK